MWRKPGDAPDRYRLSIGYGYTKGPSIRVRVDHEGMMLFGGKCLDCGGQTCRHWWAVLSAIKRGLVRDRWVPPLGMNRYDETTGEYLPMRGSRPVSINGRRVG